MRRNFARNRRAAADREFHARRAPIALLALATAILVAAFAPPPADAAFGISDFVAEVRAQDGTEYEQAGGHPFVGVVNFTVNTTSGMPDGNIKDVRVDVPPGLISNPEATPKCTDVQYAASACPASSQLGTEELTAVVLLVPTTVKVPIYNMVPPPGRVSDFAFGVPILAPRTDILGGVRSDTDFGLYFEIFDIPSSPSTITSNLTFWGVPADPAHDPERGQSCTPICLGGGIPSDAPPVPFLTNPTYCGPPYTTTLTVNSHQAPDQKLSYTDTTPHGATGCDAVPFDPSVSVTPSTTKKDSPAGLKVGLHVPQSLDPDDLGSAHVKDASVTLPPGLTLNPPAANGLEACTDEQFGKGTAGAVSCPAASKVGTVSISTHALPAPLTGTIYVGRPLDGNPYRIFVHATGSTIDVRLIGKVVPDPVTGQLTTTFADNPQVPFTDFELTFEGGPRSVVATPLKCGPATTTSSLAPWSGKPASTPTSAFTVDADGAGAACPPTPFALGFQAGTQSTQAGAFSPFTLAISRDDGHQYLSQVSLQQPPGLLGMLSNVPLCGEPEASSGTCPASSRIGTATTGAGAGSQPFTLSGPVSLTGPYKGAPFGLSIAIRAIAGPYDLGTVVVRSAIRVDPVDAHITVDSDPLPTILQGVPLRLRNITVSVDREQFIFNPTNCSPLAIGGTLTSTEGATQQTSSAFQATGCAGLAFTPRIRATSSARSSLTRGAALSVTVTQPPGQSNIRSAAVTLPRELQTRGTTLARACLQATYDANPAACPEASRVGTATAVTPVLAAPMRGTAYLVARGNKTLPGLEVLLEGQGITVRLSGTTTVSGRLTSTFQTVPDVPVTSFKLDLPIGPHSALATRANLCTAPLSLDTTFVAHSGAQQAAKVPLEIDDCQLKVVKRTVKGRTATVTVQVPAPGRITISGKNLRTVRRTVKTAGHVKVKVPLSKRGSAALKQRRSRKKGRKLILTATVRLAPSKPATGAQKMSGPTKIKTRLTFR